MINPVDEVSIELSNLNRNIILEERESSKLKEDGGHRSTSSAAGKWPNVEEVVNAPHDHQPKKFLRKWDIIFTVSSALAVFVDPLSCYIPVINDKTCYNWNLTLAWIVLALRSACDLFYGMDILVFIKRRRGNVNAKPFGASWTKHFGGPDSKIWKVLNGQKSLRFLGILPRICAAFPILQAIILTGKFAFFGNIYSKVIYLIPIQYTLRAYNLYRWLHRHANIETAVKRFLKAVLDFLPFIFAAHLYGAMWYFFSVQRELDCWWYACEEKGLGCESAYRFHCAYFPLNLTGLNITLFDITPRLNITQIRASCPINPPDTTIFDFGIFLYALQSNVTRSTSITRKMFQSFWWGLRNLSSFGSNLQTSLYGVEIFFTILVSISGMVLFLIYLNRRVQVPMLENMNENVLKAICEHLKLVKYSEDKYIVREGEPLDKMLFITQGTAWSYPTNASGSSAFKCLVKGDFYGEELLNWASKLSSFSEFPKSTRIVKAHTKVEAFAIRANNLNNVVSTFWWHFSKRLGHIEESQLERWQHLATCSIQAKWRRRHARPV